MSIEQVYGINTVPVKSKSLLER